jgi:hypothetical protein
MKNVPPEWVVLSNKLLGCKTFREDRITPESLYGVYKNGRAFIRTSQIGANLTITAFGALWDSKDPERLEMGTFWVDPAERTKGMSFEIFSNLLNLANGKLCFLITKVEKIKKAAEGAEWTCVIGTKWRNTPCRKAIGSRRPMGEGRYLCFEPTR